MQVMTTLPQENLNCVPSAALAAENVGFDMLATMENRYEPFLPLAVAAVSTKKISLGTAVAIAFPRSPMVVANCLLYTSPSPRDKTVSRMPSSA